MNEIYLQGRACRSPEGECKHGLGDLLGGGAGGQVAGVANGRMSG